MRSRSRCTYAARTQRARSTGPAAPVAGPGRRAPPGTRLEPIERPGAGPGFPEEVLVPRPMRRAATWLPRRHTHTSGSRRPRSPRRHAGARTLLLSSGQPVKEGCPFAGWAADALPGPVPPPPEPPLPPPHEDELGEGDGEPLNPVGNGNGLLGLEDDAGSAAPKVGWPVGLD